MTMLSLVVSTIEDAVRSLVFDKRHEISVSNIHLVSCAAHPLRHPPQVQLCLRAGLLAGGQNGQQRRTMRQTQLNEKHTASGVYTGGSGAERVKRVDCICRS